MKNDRTQFDIEKLTPKQLKRMDKKIVKRGIHKCMNGETLPYSVTEMDVLRREVTGNQEFTMKLQNGTVHPFEISKLLTKIYGEYPKNTLKEEYFNI